MPERPTRKLLMKSKFLQRRLSQSRDLTLGSFPIGGTSVWRRHFKNRRTQAKTRGIDVAYIKNKFTYWEVNNEL